MRNNWERQCLRAAARSIASRRNARPSGPWKALCKLVIQERRDYSLPSSPRLGWKRGELFEVAEALMRDRTRLAEEWGDVGYYVAQTFTPLWRLYAAVTPCRIIKAAVQKFERRAWFQSPGD